MTDDEWNRKGGALSEVTAQSEYGLTREFILKGIQVGKLEWREASAWGSPFLRVLRSQLERYVCEHFGQAYLESQKSSTELASITKEINSLKRKLKKLESRKSLLLRST
jgi:hypothetical protein